MPPVPGGRDGTVSGAFELRTGQARRELRYLRQAAEGTDRAFGRLGRTMDRVGGEQHRKNLKAYREEVRQLRLEAVRSHRAMRREWKTTDAQVRRSVALQRREVRKLRRDLERLGQVNAQPHVEVTGVAEALAAIESVRARMHSLGRTDAHPRVASGGMMGGGMGGGAGGVSRPAHGGGGGGRRGFVRSFSVGPLALDRRGLALIGAALPAINDVAGAAVGLGASLVSAAGGFAALGSAAAGAAAGGVIPLFAVLKPAAGQVQELYKAQEKLTESVRKYGRASKEAAAARKELNRQEARAPIGAGSFIREVRSVRRLYGAEGRRYTNPNVAQAQRIGLRAGRRGIRYAGRLSGTIGRAGIIAGRATDQQVAALEPFLMGAGRRGILDSSRMYADNIRNVRRFGQATVGTFFNINRAARPFFREGTDAIARWSEGWEKSTSNIKRTRDALRPMMRDLREWKNLTVAGGRFLGAVTGAARGPGRGLVGSATGQLNTWTEQINRNPRQVQQFFQRSVDGIRGLARALGQLGKTLFRLGEQLGPTFDRLTALVNLAGTAGLFTPGVGALALGAFRGARSARGGGGLGGAPLIAGGMGYAAARGLRGGGLGAARAGVVGAAYAQRFKPTSGTLRFLNQTAGARFAASGFSTPMRAPITAPGAVAGVAGGARYGAPVSQLGAQTGGFRRIGGGALRGAGRALPWMAAFGALDAYGYEGTAAQRLQTGLSTMSLGLINRPQTGDRARDRGAERAQDYLSSLPAGMNRRDLRAQIAGLRGRSAAILGRNIKRGGIFGVGGSNFSWVNWDVVARKAKGGDRDAQSLMAENAVIKSALKERLQLYKDYVKLRDRELRRKSADRAGRVFGTVSRGFRERLAAGQDPTAALRDTASITMGELSGRKRAGRVVLGKQFLGLAEQFKREHPELAKQIDSISKDVRARFARLGINLRVVNGRILDGSRRTWTSIANAIRNQARRGVDETAAEFQRLNQVALAQLQMMGFGSKDARDLLRFQRTGGTTAARARRYITGPTHEAPRYKVGAGDKTGGGIGGLTPEDRAARAQTAQNSRGTGLMGANPGLGRYAQFGSGYGMRVSSGRRPGSITSSGNRSLHSTGDAIDMAGTPGSMLAFARAMASRYGNGLDELIHTPLGFGIKNGRRVPLSFFGSQVNSDHYDHVHIGDRTPTGGGGGLGPLGWGGASMMVALQARKSKLGGVPGALGTQAGKAYASGLSAFLNKNLGAFGVGSGLSSFGTKGGLSKGQLAQLWIQAGGDPRRAQLMAQIAMAESGGNPRAHNPSGATGLWQILGNPFPGNAYDPMTNARMAVAKYQTQGLRAWEAYTNGAFRRFAGDGFGFSRQRASKGTRSITIHMHFGNINAGAPEDLQGILGAAAEHAAERLLAALDRVEVTA